MKTYVDGKPFKTYILDSTSSILNRIAAQKKIVLRFLKYNIETTPDGDTLITTETIGDVMSRYSTFKDFMEDRKINDYFSDSTDETLAKLWFRLMVKNPADSVMFENDISSINVSYNRIESDAEVYNKKLESEYNEFVKQVKNEEKELKKINDEPSYHSTPLEVIKIKTEVEFEVDYDIYELFNYINVSRDVPFAVIGEYYKILKDFIPLDTWSYSRERIEGDFKDKKDVLFLKTLNVRNEPIKNFKSTDPSLYSTVAIYFETPLEETRRKREERLQREEDRRREEKKREKKRREQKTEEVKIKRKKKGENKELEEEQKKKEEERRRERELLKKRNELREEEERKKREEELEREENAIVRTSKVYLRIESNVDPDFTDDEIIERVISTFPGNIVIRNKSQIQIKGEFLIPNIKFDRPIFLHHVMNDDSFSRLCAVDERSRLQKEKGGVYLYFFDSDNSEENMITCSATEQVVEKTSLKVIAKDPELKVDSSYLRIRITKAKNKEEAERFRNIFCVLISLYIQNRESTIEFYKNYFPDLDDTLDDLRVDLETNRKKSIRVKKMLKDVDPDQFISGYSRWLCPTKRAPRIIATVENPDDPEPAFVEEMESQNKQVLLFPKSANEAGGNYTQHYYSCDHHTEDKYIGLRINKLANSDKYPIVPCCYKKDHRTKNKSVLMSYIRDGKTFEEFRSKDREKKYEEEDDKHIYTTNKILPPKRYGVLVKNIEGYFSAIDIENTYIRQGVSRTYNSIIETLMMATDPDFDGLSVANIKTMREEIREKLVKLAAGSDVYQQAYNYTPDTISSYLADNKKYLDPKIFIRLLEDYFGVYIFIFSHSEDHPEGILDCPYHVKEYLQLKRDQRNVVFIYEHMGAELDKAEYPQCELILTVDENNEKVGSLPYDNSVVRRVRHTFNDMYISEPGDSEFEIESVFNSKITSQEIDYNGKTRFLQFDGGMCVLTDPLPPLSIKQGCKYSAVNINDAKKFLKTEGINNWNSQVLSGKIIGISARKGNISFYIPTVPIDSGDGEKSTMPTFVSPSFILPKSELQIYNEYHRLARCIVEYMLYLFSLYYKRNPQPEIDQSYVEGFIRDCIEIDSKFVYGRVMRLFSINNSGVLRNNKLVLHNTTVLKKLVYVLRLKLRNNKEEVKNYSDYKYIQQYYVDIRDFSQIESQPIIYGQSALRKWIDSKKPKYPLQDVIRYNGSTLLSELLKHDKSRPYLILFYANWNKSSKAVLNRLYSLKKKYMTNKNGDKVEIRDIYTKYSDRMNFVFIDIDKNRNIVMNYEISSVPFILLTRIVSDKLTEIARISCGDNIYENVKIIEKEINKISTKEK